MSTRLTVLAAQLRQKAVWWANPVLDGFGGRTFDDGLEITCRWEERQELFTDFEGRQVVSRAVVYVDRDMVVHDYLYLGTLSSLVSGQDQPFANPAAFEVRAFAKTPSLDASKFVRRAWL